MIKQGFILLATVAACLALGDRGYYSKKNTFQAPSQYASVASFHASSAPVVPQAPIQSSTQYSSGASFHASQPEPASKPQPYAFGYESAGSARQESADASGKVSGSYRVTNEDGSVRVVNYVADQEGFRANIDTDEQGVGPDSPAHVQLKAAPPKVTKFSAPAVQQVPAHATQYSAPAIQQAPIQATSYSAPAVHHQAPIYSSAPSPYSFEYAADLEDGSISRSESADASGKVVGSYSLSVADGRRRKVDYLADAAGFRATVDTNEFDTDGKLDSPADVQFYARPAPPGLYAKQITRYSAPAAQQAPVHVTSFSAPVIHHSAVQTTHYSAPAVQQAPVRSYSYDYRTSLEDGGSSARSESADGSGKVTGSYSLSVADGRRRKVDYSADNDGFRASVDTNELGTKSDSPASVHFYSSAPVSQPAAPVSQYVAPVSHVTQYSAPAVQKAPVRATHFSAPAVQQAPIQATHFSAPAVQQAPVHAAAPYAFEYEADGSSRRESADASGTVSGSYEVRNEDGSVRVVEYVADGAGFRANVKTNEPSAVRSSKVPAERVARPLSQKTVISQQHVE